MAETYEEYLEGLVLDANPSSGLRELEGTAQEAAVESFYDLAWRMDLGGSSEDDLVGEKLGRSHFGGKLVEGFFQEYLEYCKNYREVSLEGFLQDIERDHEAKARVGVRGEGLDQGSRVEFLGEDGEGVVLEESEGAFEEEFEGSSEGDFEEDFEEFEEVEEEPQGEVPDFTQALEAVSEGGGMEVLEVDPNDPEFSMFFPKDDEDDEYFEEDEEGEEVTFESLSGGDDEEDDEGFEEFEEVPDEKEDTGDSGLSNETLTEVGGMEVLEVDPNDPEFSMFFPKDDEDDEYFDEDEEGEEVTFESLGGGDDAEDDEGFEEFSEDEEEVTFESLGGGDEEEEGYFEEDGEEVTFESLGGGDDGDEEEFEEIAEDEDDEEVTFESLGGGEEDEEEFESVEEDDEEVTFESLGGGDKDEEEFEEVDESNEEKSDSKEDEDDDDDFPDDSEFVSFEFDEEEDEFALQRRKEREKLLKEEEESKKEPSPEPFNSSFTDERPRHFDRREGYPSRSRFGRDSEDWEEGRSYSGRRSDRFGPRRGRYGAFPEERRGYPEEENTPEVESDSVAESTIRALQFTGKVFRNIVQSYREDKR